MKRAGRGGPRGAFDIAVVKAGHKQDFKRGILQT